MKISADSSIFEIVLFKSTTLCIHTYFISIALCMLKGALGIIYVVRKEKGDKGKERQRDSKRQKDRSGRKKRLLRADAKKICAQLIKHLN